MWKTWSIVASTIDHLCAMHMHPRRRSRRSWIRMEASRTEQHVTRSNPTPTDRTNERWPAPSVRSAVKVQRRPTCRLAHDFFIPPPPPTSILLRRTRQWSTCPDDVGVRTWAPPGRGWPDLGAHFSFGTNAWTSSAGWGWVRVGALGLAAGRCTTRVTWGRRSLWVWLVHTRRGCMPEESGSPQIWVDIPLRCWAPRATRHDTTQRQTGYSLRSPPASSSSPSSSSSFFPWECTRGFNHATASRFQVLLRKKNKTPTPSVLK